MSFTGVPLPDELRGRPFTAAEAGVAGVSPKMLRGPTVRRLFHGVYVAADLEVTLAVHVRAAQLVVPGSIATGVTALQLAGLDLGPELPLRLLTTSPHQTRRPGLRVTRVRRLPAHRDGRVLMPIAFLQAADTLDLVDLVAAGDWLVRRKLVRLAALTEVAGYHRPGSSAITRRAASLVRDRVDSVRETRLRLMLVLAGLPEPEVNVGIGTEDWYIGSPDLRYEAYKVLLEYEGDQHRSDRRQWGIDMSRYEEFEREGYVVLRVNAERMRSPRALVRRAYDALCRGGYSGPPPVFGTEWSRLFE